ncbi:hypothetical protein HK100_005901 [Physocladia obscura]|uniref:F-box/LRR-repeat protein 15-like leucin rich repeat domain-containing protein n=1 Tax=Physocladia obscura TaxID=109957 RepID=A0AAD5T5R5_9FUNG|nr:hypothetical protein HK100_005901 [Physocladia obscura]
MQILLIVVDLLPLDTRVSLIKTSRYLRQISSDPSFWIKIILIRDFSRANGFVSQLYSRANPAVREKLVQSIVETETSTESLVKIRQVHCMKEILDVLMSIIIPTAGPVSIKEINVSGLGKLFSDAHLMQIARWCPHLETCNISGTSVTENGIQYLFGNAINYQISLDSLRDGVSRSGKPSNRIAFTGNTPIPPPLPPSNFTYSIFTATDNEFSVREFIENSCSPNSTFSTTELRTSNGQQSKSTTSAKPIHATTTAATTVDTARCAKLTNLILSGTRPVSDKTVACIAHSAAAKTLTTLDLTSYTSSSRISDTAITILARTCTVLQTLLLSGCSQITDASLLAIGGLQLQQTPLLQHKHGPKVTPHDAPLLLLRRLEISGCFQVTDFGVAAVLGACVALEALDVGYCWRITDAAFTETRDVELLDPRMVFWQGRHRIAASGVGGRGKLAYVSVKFCYLVTDVGVGALVEAMSWGRDGQVGVFGEIDVTSCQRVSRDRWPNGVLVWEKDDELF